MPQFVVCKFAASKRGYTYVNDGPPVSIGDRVEVQAPRDEGKVTVEVTGIDVPEPPFACKPILGLAPPREAPAPGTLDVLGGEVGF
jgi:hypothetical protein